MNKTRRIIVGISGASGAVLGTRLLEMLQSLQVETHLVISEAAKYTISQELNRSLPDIQELAYRSYSNHDIGAAIASGSFESTGMIIIPCSIKTLSSVANSYTSDLISRAADVTLKEGKDLVLVVRETPLHPGHIRLMALASKAGAVIYPPVPAFYMNPGSLQEVIDNLLGRILIRMGIENDYYHRWKGGNSL